MANIKLSNLTALGAAPATTDLLVLVDISDTTQAASGTTKRMTVTNLFTSPTFTTVTVSSGGLTVSAGTTAVQTLTATTGVFSGNVEIEKAAPDLILDRSSGTGDNLVRLQQSGVSKAFIGIAGSAGAIIAGSAEGDTVIRAATQKVLVSADDGTTAHVSIATTGAVTLSAGITATTGTFSGAVTAGAGSSIGLTGRARITSGSDGVLMVSNAAETDFARLQFGGTTSSFPALKRSTTALHVRLADDSGYGDFIAGTISVASQLELAGATVTGSPTWSATQNFAAVTGTSWTGTGQIKTTLTTQQLSLNYDASNHLAVTVASNGAVTYNATGAGATHTFSDAVTINSGLTVTNGIAMTSATYLAWGGNTFGHDGTDFALNDKLVITSTAQQALLKYDANNHLGITVASTGATSYTATGGSGGEAHRMFLGATEVARLDTDSTAGGTRFMLYDNDNGTLERVTVGAADSGGAGFKVLRIPN